MPTSANKWIFIGIGIGFLPVFVYTFIWYAKQETTSECLKHYRFTSASLSCASYEESLQQLRELDAVLSDAQGLYEQQGKVTRMSVWVRDLESKQWAATKEFETYAPASLMKVPLMMAYYKFADLDPGILEEKLLNEQAGDFNDIQHFGVPSKIVPGQSYTIEELIARMIEESDNNAARLLFAHIDQEFFARTLVELGLQVPNGPNTIDFVTAKTYANIFRNLYNASYLNREFSEKALEHLAATSTLVGIAHSLPAGVVVADKYGERLTTAEQGTKLELHDCGIVYTKRPYTICIMTEGQNYEDMLGVIRSVSALTYSMLSKEP